MSAVFQIEVPEDIPAYLPRQTMVGTLRWQRQRPFDLIHMSLYWVTSGKGDCDSNVVETLEWKSLPGTGERVFEILLPRAPYSIHSDNLNIDWKLAVSGKPGKDDADFDLIIAPAARVIELKALPEAGGGMRKFKDWLAARRR